jgi:SAM-dependent MidA family methyltransferase
MGAALYGSGGQGFFVRGEAAAGHFRTSVHASQRLFGGAVARLLRRVDAALGHPERLDFVDMGAGGGQLAAAVLAALPEGTVERVRVHAVELAPRPEGLDSRVAWGTEPPRGARGLLFANEWLDNVPLDVAAPAADGTVRYVEVDQETGAERLGDPLEPEDTQWLARWWPVPERDGPGRGPGGDEDWRAEIGRSRDEAWAHAVASMGAGLAVAVDYGHTRADRPRTGTLTGYRNGRQVPPRPDGSCDLTAHVAMDALGEGTLTTQRAALHALGVAGRRPPLALAAQDPTGYVRALAAATEAAELTAPGGLGDFLWLTRPITPACATLLTE